MPRLAGFSLITLITNLPFVLTPPPQRNARDGQRGAGMCAQDSICAAAVKHVFDRSGDGPPEHPDQVLDSPHVRVVIPKAEYDDGAAPQQLRVHCTRIRTPGFKLHEQMLLPDRPPVNDGSSCSPVHRFVLEASRAAALNVQLRREASERTSSVRRLFGESRSNRGGYHSIEEELELVQGKPVWYDALLAEVILPAMRALNGQCMGGKDAVDSRGVPLEGRLTGWLSVNDVHDFNALHSHGLDVGWALVYYVSTGDEAEGSDNAAAVAAAPPPGGLLLLQTTPDEAKGRSRYLPIVPRAGELWAFPGYMSHAVTPREPREPREERLGATVLAALRGLGRPAHARPRPRVSVACNIYLLSSSYRDALIGHTSHAATDGAGGDGAPSEAHDPTAAAAMAAQASELGCGWCVASRHPAKRRSARLSEARLACSKWQLQARGLRKGAASETVDELSARRSRILSRAQRDPDLELIT